MWAQILNALVGVGLIAAPRVLNLSNPAADMFYIVGPVAATFATVACWEATRGLRWANLPIGIWLIAAPWILGFGSTPAVVASTIAGALLAGFACVEGTVEKSYGGGWTALWRPERLAGSGRRGDPVASQRTSEAQAGRTRGKA